MQLPYQHHTCVIGDGAMIDVTAAVIGRVVAGRSLVMRDHGTIRADGEAIRIGNNGHFGSRATVHIADSLLGTTVGDDVTVGCYSLVHACLIGDRVVIGEGSAVIDGASVGSDALVAADSIVPPGKTLAAGWLYQGVPAKPIREVLRAEVRRMSASIRDGSPDPIVRSTAVPEFAHEPGLRAREDGAWRHAAWHRSAYVAPTSLVAGHVELNEDAGVYFGCVVTASGARIVIGRRSNVQDNCFLVTTEARGDLVIGDGATIGHNVQLGAGLIGDDALIGMLSRVGDGVVVENNGCIAAGAWAEPGTIVKAGWIWSGRPARPFRELKPAERMEFARGRDAYVTYGRSYSDARRESR
jgi:gamma-carbonic anhydrase